ncbi:hypothetical protein HHI36_006960 [Cryptolaemus montrouzieri]|uniref:Uncharacterized protein n=1 Tax=Cryptolaemus montrouzieri TaxID=559131 RepID=A0ABD2MNA3_9CUCU
MKVLLFVSCALAVASAGYSPYYHAVIGPDGHPVETPEVQHAKAAHYVAHAQALTRVAHGVPYVPVAHYGIVPGAISHDGRPLDTPEVAAAKLKHYQDYAIAAHRNSVPAGHGLVLGHVALAGPHPIDTPEVQLAKAAHFAAHAQASARAHGHYRRRRGIFAYPQHIPVIDAKGVPVETPEVQAAKAFHLAKHAEVSARSGHLSYVPQVYSPSYPASLPVVSHNGVPLDTPEVAVAKAHHFAAHQQAAAKVGAVSPLLYAAPYHHGGAVIGPDGRPIETPEVQHAKAAHFAAHAAAHHY